MTCTCATKGWTRRDDDIWVCAKCGMPSGGYLEMTLAQKDKVASVETRVNLMRYGPIHHTVLSNEEMASNVLLKQREDADALIANLHDYRWTPEVVTGSESGRAARVWVWKEA